MSRSIVSMSLVLSFIACGPPERRNPGDTQGRACERVTECFNGETCVEGRCVKGCLADEDCASGVCDRAVSTCVEEADGGDVDGGDVDGGDVDGGDVDGGDVDGGDVDGGDVDGGDVDGGHVPVGCKLAFAPTLDFGSVGVGHSQLMDYVVGNEGDEPCVVRGIDAIHPAEGARISSGSTFVLASLPVTTTVLPGKSLKFEITYSPNDLVGPDVGEFITTYWDEGADSPVSQIKVQLSGTPVGDAVCVLTAQPEDAGSSERSLKFGEVRVQAKKVLPVTFTNVGTGNCGFTSTSIVPDDGLGGIGGDDSPYFKVSSLPRSPLPPGESTTVDVSFAPNADRAFGGEMLMPGMSILGGVMLQVSTTDSATFPGTGNDACSNGGGNGAPGCVSWNLFGEGVKSDLVTLPGDVNFGRVATGCSSREEIITLYNVGTVTATITAITLDPADNPAVFTVVHPPLPFTVSGGTSLQLKVKYRPSGTGIHTANILISTDATNAASGDIIVGLRGAGTKDTRVTDAFTQSDRPKADILFVVDDSGSMSEEQAALANSASLFITADLNRDIDFQIGVVTTDTDVSPGVLRFTAPSPQVIVNGPNAASDFARTVRGLGTNGSATEKGLQSMVDTLSSARHPTVSGEFHRPGANLAVVVVSDEEDYSSAPVEFYTAFLKHIKGIRNEASVVLSAIVGDNPNGCSSNNGAADAGSRYIAVQQATNGYFRSICSTDWVNIGADLQVDAGNARARFLLSRDAVGTSIEVRVDGTTSVATDWSYDAVSQAVVFKPAAVPEAGLGVVVEYDAACSN